MVSAPPPIANLAKTAKSDRLVRLRTLVAADVERCAALVEQTALFEPYGYGAEEAAADLRAELKLARQASTMLVAEVGESLVGFCRFLVKGSFDRCGYLRLIVVDSAHTSGGVGRALLLELEHRYLHPHGIMLLCAQTNAGARAFYERLNYRQVGLVEDYVKSGLHECIYYKPAPNNETPSAAG